MAIVDHQVSVWWSDIHMSRLQGVEWSGFLHGKCACPPDDLGEPRYRLRRAMQHHDDRRMETGGKTIKDLPDCV
jgi:hypothetical protein